MDAIPRTPFALLLAILILLAPWRAAMAAERLLHGLVQTVGAQGELAPAPNVEVALVQTGVSAATDSLGIFLLELTPAQVAGRQVQLLVRKDGWVIDHPLEGRVDIPDDLAARVVELRLLPKGSKRLWTDERIESLIAELAEKAAAAVKSSPSAAGAGTVPTQGPPPDFTALIADWSGRYGFGPAEVQAQIDRWAAETEARADDPYRLGLAAYAKKNFADAFSRGMESGDAYAGRLAAARERERDLLEKTLRGYELAGDSAMAEYRFRDALAAYGKGLAEVREDESPELWARMTVLVANARTSLGIRVGGAAAHRYLAEAIIAYREALQVYTHDMLPQGWAAAQNNLANTLQAQGIRADGENGQRLLAEAVAAYRDALTVHTSTELPQQWAATQANLGTALEEQALRTGGKAGQRLLTEAVSAYREALTVCPSAEQCQTWLETKMNLGGAINLQATRTTGQDAQRLREDAITAFRDALSACSRSKLPQVYAMVQTNLGAVLRQQGASTGGEDGQHLLADSIAAYDEALAVLIPAQLPQMWAKTRNNLGIALRELAGRTSGEDRWRLLGEAVAAHRDALTVFTRADLPQNWAHAQDNLAGALFSQGTHAVGDDATHLFAQSVAAYREALSVQRRTEFPLDWAGTMNALGNTLVEQGARAGGEEGRRLLAEAIAAHRDALTVYTRADLPQEWAGTQNDLGIALATQGSVTAGDDGQRLLEQAVAAHGEALTVYTRDVQPRHWADIHLALGNTLLTMGSRKSLLVLGPPAAGQRTRQLLIDATSELHEALTVYRFPEDAPSWDATQQDLLRAYQALRDATGIVTVTEQLLGAEPDNTQWCAVTKWAHLHADLDTAHAERLALARRHCPSDDLAARRVLAETMLNKGRLDEARTALAALIAVGAPDTPVRMIDPETQAILRLLEIVVLTGLGNTDTLRSRQAELRALVAARPTAFMVRWNFQGTTNYISTAPAFATCRAPLLALIQAAAKGRDALLAAIDSAGAGLAGEPVADRSAPGQ